jgi:hypothetical protein
MKPKLVLGGYMLFHYEKMGWFAIGLAIEFLNYNDYLQFITIQYISMHMSVIKKITLIALDATPHMWNGIHMQLVQLSNNYLEIIIV